MRMTRCRLHEITVRGPNGLGRAFGFGAFADLDEVFTSEDGKTSITLAELLGPHVAAFEPIAPEPVPAPEASGRLSRGKV